MNSPAVNTSNSTPIDRRDAGRTQKTARGPDVAAQRAEIGARNVLRPLRCRERQAMRPRILGNRPDRDRESDDRQHDRRRDRLEAEEEERRTEGEQHGDQERAGAQYPRQSVARHDVQLPKDSDQPEHREHDDELIGESRIDVRSKEQRESADTDYARDPVKRLHLDEKPQHPERQQESADDRIGRKANELLGERVGLRYDRSAGKAELRERRAEVRRSTGGDTRTHRVLGIERQHHAGAFVSRKIHLLIDHRSRKVRVVVRALRRSTRTRRARRRSPCRLGERSRPLRRALLRRSRHRGP